MSQPSPKSRQKMRTDPDFMKLVANRARLRWGLSCFTVALFFGFVFIISTAPEALGRDLPHIRFPIGLTLALAMVALMVGITGTYVFLSNFRLDPLSKKIAANEAKQ
ncbi:hypothetical protein R69619_04577 [Paraburkholderia nemoris]|uniref:DUF485 domain-containing protein n=1 Tax=Paraburkholderia nemoris TaxID=2793076 RepID=UPI00190D3077|nr:DUF485 domain-containing protein [Paraburkholderia nemoris]MBK3742585.1 DUF485 domain-containing protein [Paraburkholderia aspalathi]CAE6787111.1 hypothetical protein R69619_04577 [Paraburkholderia nemoris]